jgi:hypothetical protein
MATNKSKLYIRDLTIKFMNCGHFQSTPLGSYAPMPVPTPPFKIILELVLWNGLQSCCHVTPNIINVIKMPSF